MREPVDEGKVQCVLAMLNEITRRTDWIVSGDDPFIISENGGYGSFLVVFNRDTNTYYTHAKPRRIEADG